MLPYLKGLIYILIKGLIYILINITILCLDNLLQTTLQESTNISLRRGLQMGHCSLHWILTTHKWTSKLKWGSISERHRVNHISSLCDSQASS